MSINIVTVAAFKGHAPGCQQGGAWGAVIFATRRQVLLILAVLLSAAGTRVCAVEFH